MSKVIKLGNYKGIEFKVEKVPVSNEEVERHPEGPQAGKLCYRGA